MTFEGTIGSKYFTNDENEDDESEELKTLSWCGNREETNSDRNIVISNDTDEPQRTYHVHKCVLAAGAYATSTFPRSLLHPLVFPKRTTAQAQSSREATKQRLFLIS